MPIRMNASMIPQTVPNRPMNGVTLPVVARKPIIFSIRATSALEALVRARLRFSRRAPSSRGGRGLLLGQVGHLLEAGLEDGGQGLPG